MGLRLSKDGVSPPGRVALSVVARVLRGNEDGGDLYFSPQRAKALVGGRGVGGNDRVVGGMIFSEAFPRMAHLEWGQAWRISNQTSRRH